MHRETKLLCNLFADAPVSSKLQAGNFAFAESFGSRHAALVERKQVDHDLARSHVQFDDHIAGRLEIIARKDNEAVANGAEAHRKRHAGKGSQAALQARHERCNACRTRSGAIKPASPYDWKKRLLDMIK